MKCVQYLLSLVISLTALQGAGQDKPIQYQTARDVLIAQYSELEDLRVNLQHHEKIKTGGWIGIVISGAAVAGGAFLRLGSAMNNTYVVRGDKVGEKLAEGAVVGTVVKMPFTTRSTLLVLGGLAGVLTSSTVIYMQKHQIAELRIKIESLQERLRRTIVEIEEIRE